MSGKSVAKRSSRSKKLKEIESPSSFLESERPSAGFKWDSNMRKQSTKSSTDGVGRKRKLHKTYIKGWNEDIAKNGFARCIIASCNFTSSDIASMQKHHKTCFAVVSNDENSTEECESGLSASELQNSPFKEQTVVNSQNSIHVSNSSFQKWDHQIKTIGQAFCGNQDCNFVGMTITDLENHRRSCLGVPNFSLFCCIHCRCGFSTKEDHLKHQKNCSVTFKLGANPKKIENLHFRVIKQKSKNSSEDHIIQPGPDLPKGQYRRRRAYRAEHKNSWALTLEKYKYVKCIYQNCYFIAMSLEDMIAHFGYCNGDGSFAKFICPYCNGRVTSEAVLLKHIERSHASEKASIKVELLISKNNKEPEELEEPEESGEPEELEEPEEPEEFEESEELELEFEELEQPEEFEELEQPEEPEEFEELEQPEESEQLEEPEEPKQPEQSEESEEPKQLEQPEESEEPKQPEQSEESEKPKQLEQPKEPELPEPFEVVRSPETELYEEEIKRPVQEQESHEESETIPSDCRKLWNEQITEFGNAYCRKSLCNFMAPNIKDLEVHVKTCDGTPDFEVFNCDKCRYRLPTQEELDLHVPLCKDEKMKYSTAETNPQNETAEEDEFEMGPVLRQYEGKRSRTYTKKHKVNSVSETPKNNSNKRATDESDAESDVSNEKPRKRPRRSAEVVVKKRKDGVTCGKCGHVGTKNGFVSHNLKAHVGLGWIEGEEPVDLNDEKLVIKLVKEAFRLNKKGACELCSNVKRSVLGFVTHIQTCGKSEEEKNAVKVQCPHCKGKYLKYSINAHLRICSLNPDVEEEKNETVGRESDVSGKRRSAIRAASMCQLVLNENENDEPEPVQESSYVFYKKGSDRPPKLNSKLNNLWYKLRRESRKIPCRLPGCRHLSTEVRDAKRHHYNCPFLPKRVYLCEICDFYSIEESDVKSHLTTHRKYSRHRQAKVEDEVQLEDIIKNEDVDEEDEEDEKEEEEEEEEEKEAEEEEEEEKEVKVKRKLKEKEKEEVIVKVKEEVKEKEKEKEEVKVKRKVKEKEKEEGIVKLKEEVKEKEEVKVKRRVKEKEKEEVIVKEKEKEEVKVREKEKEEVKVKRKVKEKEKDEGVIKLKEEVKEKEKEEVKVKRKVKEKEKEEVIVKEKEKEKEEVIVKEKEKEKEQVKVREKEKEEVKVQEKEKEKEEVKVKGKEKEEVKVKGKEKEEVKVEEKEKEIEKEEVKVKEKEKEEVKEKKEQEKAKEEEGEDEEEEEEEFEDEDEDEDEDDEEEEEEVVEVDVEEEEQKEKEEEKEVEVVEEEEEEEEKEIEVVEEEEEEKEVEVEEEEQEVEVEVEEQEQEQEQEQEKEEKQKEKEDEEEFFVQEEEIKSTDEEVEEEPRKRRKIAYRENKTRRRGKVTNEFGKLDIDIELRLKQNFCRREKIENIRGIQFYSNGLEMTLEEEVSTELEPSETWPELHTTLGDWSQVPLQQAFQYFPQLAKSVSVRFSEKEKQWRIFERFNGDLINGVPVMFTGGSIRSMSWCKISFRRMIKRTHRQYLAVISARKIDYFKDIYDRTTAGKSTFLQIWDCGVLDDEVRYAPKLALGLIQKGGEIWDLAWFPNDSYTEGNEYRLRRLGLLATASEDGIVRVWSICDPSQLESCRGLPLYVTDPVVILKTDTEVEESCLQLSVTSDGILAGGFSNGTVAVWNLKNIYSPFCKKLGKCRIIRAHLVFQPHKTAITALSFCPLNSRYISTSALDRFTKIWDLESPSVPVELNNKDCSLDNIWTMNWPCIIHNFDDILINFNKGAVKFIKDILNERHQTTFAMEDPCLTISFSDWLNAICAGSITGEVKLRLMKNFINDQKRIQTTISTVRLEKLFDDKKNEERGNDKDFPISYDDVEMRFGLVFKDHLGLDKGKPKKPEAHPEEFPIRAVNKIAFNPNFKSFTHIALGYNCGLIRIQQLKELQSAKSLKVFLEKTQRGMF